VTARPSRETWIGIAATARAVAAMAVDHRMGDDAPILEDPAAFLLASLLCVSLALFVFGRLVPRTKESQDAPVLAAKRGFALSVVAAVGMFLLFWLGVPFVLGAGGVALGLVGLEGERRRLATAAAILGGLVVVLGTLGYAAQFIDKL
jgi:hypothetical protein